MNTPKIFLLTLLNFGHSLHKYSTCGMVCIWKIFSHQSATHKAVILLTLRGVVRTSCVISSSTTSLSTYVHRQKICTCTYIHTFGNWLGFLRFFSKKKCGILWPYFSSTTIMCVVVVARFGTTQRVATKLHRSQSGTIGSASEHREVFDVFVGL